MTANTFSKIGFGGGCHWCTEAIFQSIKGVIKVAQGYIASIAPNNSLSEGVIVTYNPKIISLKTLISIHLQTHSSQSDHSFRKTYRSAVYWYDPEDASAFAKAIQECQPQFEKEIITQFLPFECFEASRQNIQNYYKKYPDAPFCERYIVPKLEKVQLQFKKQIIF